MKHLVVIGGSDAGISAALRAREIDPSWQVSLVCADAFPNFSICGLPFFLSGETPRWESLAHRTRAEIESRGIELWLDCVAETIDPAAHRVRVTTAERGPQFLPYDRLVIATGAIPAPPPIAGLDTPGVYPLHTMGEKLTDDLARGAQMLVTMGCGEQCPVVPGLTRDDWPLEDPKGKPIARVREIRDDVRARVTELLRTEGWAKA